jgi:hypothetical protein
MSVTEKLCQVSALFEAVSLPKTGVPAAAWFSQT